MTGHAASGKSRAVMKTQEVARQPHPRSAPHLRHPCSSTDPDNSAVSCPATDCEEVAPASKRVHCGRLRSARGPRQGRPPPRPQPNVRAEHQPVGRALDEHRRSVGRDVESGDLAESFRPAHRLRRAESHFRGGSATRAPRRPTAACGRSGSRSRHDWARCRGHSAAGPMPLRMPRLSLHQDPRGSAIA